MTTGLILIAAILVLGGVIASVGDRIGTKVGKARLSLFNLRPKNTAVLVTLLTGSLISGSTLAVLFAASDQLRTGVFKLETIQKNLKNARQEVEETRAEKSQLEAEKNQLEIQKDRVETQKRQVEEELAQAKSQQAAAQKRLDETNQSLQAVLAKLSDAIAKQARTEAQLNRTQAELSDTQGQLSQTQEQLKVVSQQAQDLRSEIAKLQSERKDLIAQRDRVREQITELKAQLDQRDQKIAVRDRKIVQQDEKIAAQDREISQRDRKIALQDREISQREREIEVRQREIEARQREVEVRDGKIASQDRVIAQQETRLKSLEKQLNNSEVLIAEREKLITEKEKLLTERGKQLDTLQQEVATLEQYYEDYQALRAGNVRLLRGQVLSGGVVRIVEPKAARSAVDQLLLQANRAALQRIRPGDKNLKEQVILIRENEVKRLIEEIKDGKDYVVRIISAGNYVMGESPVQVFADVAPNRVVFQAGEVLAATSADPAKMTDDQLRERIELLIAASQFKARRAGILANTMQIGDDRIETLTKFLEQLKQSRDPVDVQVVASDITYTAGPVKMDLIAIQGGQVIFRTSPTS